MYGLLGLLDHHRLTVSSFGTPFLIYRNYPLDHHSVVFLSSTCSRQRVLLLVQEQESAQLRGRVLVLRASPARLVSLARVISLVPIAMHALPDVRLVTMVSRAAVVA